MEKRSGLRRIDCVAMLGCATLVLMTLGAAADTGRSRAKEAVCQANLHRWGDIFGGIVEENGGSFLSGTTDRGYWWPIQLPEELQDWKRNRTWFCPMATAPTANEKGEVSPLAGTFTAWGIFRNPVAVYQGKTYYMTRSGITGSYGLNGYVIPIPESQRPRGTNAYDSGVPASEGWRNLLDVPDGGRVPMFLDAFRFDLWPTSADAPDISEIGSWMGSGMTKGCINRHDGTVNCLFVDGSVRKVGLKELWTLKWHRSFNTAGPWTKAGGVQAENWPEWIRPFKEY